MSVLLIITLGTFVATLLGLLVWSAGRKSVTSKSLPSPNENLSLACRHLTNLPQIRQALEPGDLAYIANRSNRGVARAVRQERLRIASLYLESLREDFEQLIEAAQVVASLSPKVEAGQEWKRFRLTLEFRLKYLVVRARLAMGSPAFMALSRLALLVSSLALDIEKAVAKIGEAAVLTSNLSSSADC
jgi:hypothetical protein